MLEKWKIQFLTRIKLDVLSRLQVVPLNTGHFSMFLFLCHPLSVILRYDVGEAVDVSVNGCDKL